MGCSDVVTDKILLGKLIDCKAGSLNRTYMAVKYKWRLVCSLWY